MPWSIADTDYDNTHPWDSMYNGMPSSDVYKQDPLQQRLMSQAAMTADMGTPADVIRVNMTAGLPADAGPARPEPTIDGVLSGADLQTQHLYDRAPTDFSGTPAGIEASSRNNISIG
jgi:hypothetical protein